MICASCHHKPSERRPEDAYWGVCRCGCHDVADAAPALLNACQGALIVLDLLLPISGEAVSLSARRALAEAIAQAKRS